MYEDVKVMVSSPHNPFRNEDVVMLSASDSRGTTASEVAIAGRTTEDRRCLLSNAFDKVFRGNPLRQEVGGNGDCGRCQKQIRINSAVALCHIPRYLSCRLCIS